MTQGGAVRRRSLASLLTVTALIASAGFVAKPSHAAVTLGSDLATEPTTFFSCTTAQNDRGCLFVNDVIPGRGLVSPIDGVIVRWRVRLGNDTVAQSIRIRVVRAFDSSHFTVVSSGDLQPVPAGAGTYTFPAQLAIRSGEQVAGEADRNTDIEWGANLAGAHLFGYNPSPSDGTTTDDPVFDDPDREVTLNADVEPDCDKDGLGDETQDPDTASCQPPCGGKTPTIAGTNGPDTIAGTRAADVIVGLGGNDKLSGLAGDDVICGGPGKDTLKGGKGNDKLYGQKGKDTLKGGPGKDRLKGGPGKDKQIQ